MPLRGRAPDVGWSQAALAARPCNPSGFVIHYPSLGSFLMIYASARVYSTAVGTKGDDYGRESV